MASPIIATISPKGSVSRLKSPFRLDQKMAAFAFSVARASPSPTTAAVRFSPLTRNQSSVESKLRSSQTLSLTGRARSGMKSRRVITPSSFLTPGVLPVRRRSYQDGTPTLGKDDATGSAMKRNSIRPLRASPLFAESPYFGSSQFSASKACQALIHSPCRSENYRRQRRRLYHQDEYEDVKRKLSLPESGGGAGVFRTPKLGKGGFGSVYIGKYDGKKVAIKQLHKGGQKGSLCSELNAFRLNHPNIVKIVTFSCSGPHMQIVFEYIGRRNLQQLLDDTNHAFQKMQRVEYCRQIAAALHFCHINRILHLDVKPSNILVTDDTNTCKLADFGCSRFMNSGQTDTTAPASSLSASTPGTLMYKAPELLRGAIPSAKADVYSFGYVMWQCATRQQPFEGLSTHTIVFCVVAKGLRPTLNENLLEKMTEEERMLTELAQECWNGNPAARPEMKQLREVLG